MVEGENLWIIVWLDREAYFVLTVEDQFDTSGRSVKRVADPFNLTNSLGFRQR